MAKGKYGNGKKCNRCREVKPRKEFDKNLNGCRDCLAKIVSPINELLRRWR